ncbi:amino acid permease 3 [Cryptomeria japonica]|uniref:amino acid permease 3 n=1 Tax=Cryptomeria japonica TaxID=3369 RepID=UPI0025AB858E|nr:amino acid permease 3 [Cryptomeria japonica]
MAEVEASLIWNNEINRYHLSNEITNPRTGTLWTATAHIITAVIGAGVLSLAWSVAQLGWIAGPAIMLVFALITYYSSSLLADCYKFPDPVFGPNRNYTYRDAVKENLGDRQAWLCGLVQYVSLYGVGIAYTITASISMRAIRQSNCYHKNGHDYPCHFSETTFMIIFGMTQLILSQIPNFHKVWGLSIVASIMSISYATIGLGLGIAKVAENGELYGSIAGISSSTTISTSQKAWLVLQAIGDIAFAYPYSIIVIEIEDTLKSEPPENKTMKKASMISVTTTTFFYLLCGCFGYAAFGENAPGNLLTGFGFYEPYWLIDFANACIVVHMVGAYQVYCQPLFAFIEDWFLNKWPNNRTVSNEYGVAIPLLGLYYVNLFRLFWRTAFVVSTTVIAILIPSFNDVLGLLGAINFWPLAVHFPVAMYMVKNKVQQWTITWFLLQALSFICLLVSVATAMGSIEGLVEEVLPGYKMRIEDG